MSFCPSESGAGPGRVTDQRFINERTAGSISTEETRTGTNEPDIQGIKAPIDPTLPLALLPAVPLRTDVQRERKPRRPVRSSSTLTSELVSPFRDPQLYFPGN
jgi:hypothetical protein